MFVFVFSNQYLDLGRRCKKVFDSVVHFYIALILSEKKDGFEWRNDGISDYGSFVMGKDF